MASGVPVARHPQGAPDEECGVDLDCVAGWIMRGQPGAAKFLDHGGEIIPVRLGIDNKSHLNLVTNYAEVSGITLTR